MNEADDKLQKILSRLNTDEWETLRDRFADFLVSNTTSNWIDVKTEEPSKDLAILVCVAVIRLILECMIITENALLTIITSKI